MEFVDQAKEYAKKIRTWIEPFLAEKETPVTTHRCCMSVNSHSISLIHVDKTSPLKILQMEHIKHEGLESLSLMMPGILERFGLETVPIYWLLPPDEYQLFFIDSLAVPKNELDEALHWRIKSLINYPIEETSIDYFTCPPKKANPTNPMIGAVVTRSSYLQQIIDVFEDSKLKLTTIDIPELAMRNLTALHEEDEKSTAMLYIYKNNIILNITRKKTLYFTRRIVLPMDGNNNINFEKFSLEILRYFDYFQSQWRHPTPNRVFIAATNDITIGTIAQELSKRLLFNILPYTLPTTLIDAAQAKMIEKDYLLLFGCTLREG